MNNITLNIIQSHEGRPEVSEPYFESRDCLIKTMYDSYHVARLRKSVIGPSYWWINGGGYPMKCEEITWWGEINGECSK